MKLEIGCGQRPTAGYLHNDIQSFPGVDIDLVCPAQLIELPDESVDEVLALGVVEHLTYKQVDRLFSNVVRMLHTGGEFLFDVPDLTRWCTYLYELESDIEVPFTLEHVLATIYGWQRWEGDEHKSGWVYSNLEDALMKAGFGFWDTDALSVFEDRGHIRNRMDRPWDAHFYVRACV